MRGFVKRDVSGQGRQGAVRPSQVEFVPGERQGLDAPVATDHADRSVGFGQVRVTSAKTRTEISGIFLGVKLIEGTYHAVLTHHWNRK